MLVNIAHINFIKFVVRLLANCLHIAAFAREWWLHADRQSEGEYIRLCMDML